MHGIIRRIRAFRDDSGVLVPLRDRCSSQSDSKYRGPSAGWESLDSPFRLGSRTYLNLVVISKMCNAV